MRRANRASVELPLLQLDGAGSTPISASDLRFVQIERERFLALNAAWHRTLPHFSRSIARMLYPVFAAIYDGTIYAVAAWSNPVARNLPQDTVRELRRFAIAPDAPRNTGSRMLAWMAREVCRLLPNVKTLITYQDLDNHAGTIYRAAGWTPVPTEPAPSWANRPGRRNSHVVRKIRWEWHAPNR